MHSMRNVWGLCGSVPLKVLGSRTLVFPDEESRSVEAKATLVSTCTACVKRSRGSGVSVLLDGVGELGNGMLGGPGNGGLLLPPPHPVSAPGFLISRCPLNVFLTMAMVDASGKYSLKFLYINAFCQPGHRSHSSLARDIGLQ